MKSPTLVFFNPAALSQEEDGLGLDRREQVHHGRRHRTSHAEIQDRQVSAVADCMGCARPRTSTPNRSANIST